MSFNVEGKVCEYCHAKLFSDDDVVICPECGAPYHRECYKSLGHCVLEQFHGTENSYDNLIKQKQVNINEDKDTEDDSISAFASDNSGVEATIGVKCRMCGEEYNANASACPSCGTPNISKFGGNAIFFDFLGGVSPDLDLGEGVTADEAKKFVMANTNKYIPKFEKMKKGKKLFFNILAFLFPVPWLFSRKMYKWGAFIGAVQVALSAILMPYLKIMSPSSSTATYDEMTNNLSTFFSGLSRGNLVFHISVISAVSLITVLIHILLGIFGDLIYRNYVISSLKDIKSDTEADFEESIHKRGGVSLIMLALGFLITNYLPGMIAGLAGV